MGFWGPRYDLEHLLTSSSRCVEVGSGGIIMSAILLGPFLILECVMPVHPIPWYQRQPEEGKQAVGRWGVSFRYCGAEDFPQPFLVPLQVVIDKHPVRFFVHKRPHVDFFLEVVSLQKPKEALWWRNDLGFWEFRRFGGSRGWGEMGKGNFGEGRLWNGWRMAFGSFGLFALLV